MALNQDSMSNEETIEEDEESQSEWSYPLCGPEPESSAASTSMGLGDQSTPVIPLRPLPPLHRIPKTREEDFAEFREEPSYYTQCHGQISFSSDSLTAQQYVLCHLQCYHLVAPYYSVAEQQFGPEDQYGRYPSAMSSLPPLPKLHPAPFLKKLQSTENNQMTESPVYTIESPNSTVPLTSSTTSAVSICSSPDILSDSLTQSASPTQSGISTWSGSSTQPTRLKMHPAMWTGYLILKNEYVPVKMHYLFGNSAIAENALYVNSNECISSLKITLRMKIEQTHIQNVKLKMKVQSQHCMLLGLVSGSTKKDILKRSDNLQNKLLNYLHQKKVAGIITICDPESKQARYLIHIFPSCDFTNKQLTRVAPELLPQLAFIAHLLIIIIPV